MIFPKQLEIVERHVQDAIHQGATVLTGGHAKDGRYFAPTVLTNVTDEMAICRDESFGPVLPVMKVADAEEAIKRACGTIYGLSAYVFTRNIDRGRRVAERIRAGTVDVNDVLITHAAPETPWGGVKASGLSHTHSDDGLRHLCEARHVNYSFLPPFPNPWLFPYRASMQEAATRLTKGLYGDMSLGARIFNLGKGLWLLLNHYRRMKQD